MKKFTYLVLAALLVAPIPTFAALGGIQTFITDIKDLVNDATVIVAGIALLAFFWGLMKFILKVGGDAKAAEEGKKLMIWGIIALFVMTAVWGIIYFIGDQLGTSSLSEQGAPVIPRFDLK